MPADDCSNLSRFLAGARRGHELLERSIRTFGSWDAACGWMQRQSTGDITTTRAALARQGRIEEVFADLDAYLIVKLRRLSTAAFDRLAAADLTIAEICELLAELRSPEGTTAERHLLNGEAAALERLITTHFEN